MGFYIRKSMSVGPLRFNLSSGGVGVSVGVRGFRVGTGPRGNYVHMGRHGLYYRQTLAPSRARTHVPAVPQLQPQLTANSIPSGTHAPLQEIVSADASNIHDSNSDALLNEIREKRQKISMVPFAVLVVSVLLVIAFGNDWPGWLIGTVSVLGTVGCFFARQRDKLEKTVVIFYNFESEVEDAYRGFCEWASAVAQSHRIWHVDAAGRVYNRKYHAGASQLVSRSSAAVREAAPPFVKTNVPVYCVAAGKNALYFFPDRLFVYNGRDVGAVSYGSVDVQASAERFIEEQGVPSDATVVDYTWRYVNKNGGPDRRFNNNPRLPICKYDELSLRTSSGLNELLQVSRSGVAAGFSQAVQQMAAVVR